MFRLSFYFIAIYCFTIMQSAILLAEDSFNVDYFAEFDDLNTNHEDNNHGLSFKSNNYLQNKPIYDPLFKVNSSLYYTNYHLFSSAELLVVPFYPLFKGGKPSSGSFTYLSNFIRNTGEPVSVVNFLLMGKFKLAFLTTTAFVTNSTLGVLGIFNVSDSLLGINAYYNAQFGITTVYYTNIEGPFTFIPVMGPNYFTDLVGFGVDLFFDPLFYFSPIFAVSASLARRMESYFSSRSGIDLLISLSTSEYLGAQSLYYQKRRLIVEQLRIGEYINAK